MISSQRKITSNRLRPRPSRTPYTKHQATATVANMVELDLTITTIQRMAENILATITILVIIIRDPETLAITIQVTVAREAPVVQAIRMAEKLLLTAPEAI